jgi:hypothetical protein
MASRFDRLPVYAMKIEKYHYCAVRGKTKWIALAKHEPFTSDNPDPITEPGDLWFEFGDTPEEAIKNLKSSLGQTDL